MKKRAKWWFLCVPLIFQIIPATIATNEVADTPTFAFNTNTKFIYASVNIPSNTSRVFGVFEPNSSENNNTVFEIDYSSGRDVLTFPVDRLPLSIGNASAYCSDVDLSSGFDIEINEDSLVVRAKNSRKYILKKQLVPPEKFKILFFFLSLEEGPCLLPAIMSLTHTKYPYKSNAINPFTESYPSRTTTRKHVGYVSFATFKVHRRPKTTPATPAPTIHTGAKKTKKDAPETRGGWTSELNSEWSLVFFLLFGIVFVLVVVFILFGLIVFVLLQIRPNNLDKHVYADF